MIGLNALALLARSNVALGDAASEFSRTTARHVVASTHSSLEVVLVALGIIVVVVTTVYTLLYLIRPQEQGEDHIKRQILQDGARGSR